MSERSVDIIANKWIDDVNITEDVGIGYLMDISIKVMENDINKEKEKYIIKNVRDIWLLYPFSMFVKYFVFLEETMPTLSCSRMIDRSVFALQMRKTMDIKMRRGYEYLESIFLKNNKWEY